MKWLKDGDRNTRFFHSLAKIRYAKNLVFTLKINEVITEDNEATKTHGVDFYKNLFTASNNVSGDLSVV